jgi:hypothetical protein
MFLAKIAQKNMKEVFSGYDRATKTFVERAFEGRIDLTDRFLSIYNRPTRKRQLYVSPSENLPDSYVFKHPSSGDVYILGQERQDARHDVERGSTYVKMIMCHVVTPKLDGSSGLAKQMRKVPQGPPENPGWLVEEEVTETFMDIEFRTSSAEQGSYDIKIENFYAWTPITVDADQQDFFLLNGINYRVVDTFTDLGMRGLRLDRETDNRVDFVITVSEKVYDLETHKTNTVKTSYNVTGIIPDNTDVSKWGDARAASSIDIVIEEAHIGFPPKPNMTVQYQGLSRIVKNVTTQAGEKQYRLVCE